jgi:prepilin-type N-terminal cleavage/methylation domain-containing protein
MSGTSKVGFTLIEILVAVALIALLATVVAPNLGRRSPRVEREKFVAKLNALMQFAWQDALITNKLHQVDIDFTKRVVTVLVESGKDSQGKKIFQQVKRAYMDTRIAWPRNFEVKNFYIDGKDAMEESALRATAGAYFYVVPDGLTQEIILNCVDAKDRLRNGNLRLFSLVLNPFSAQFTYYDTFQK